ncbi:MAG: phenylalanine--tRNA ligase subunit beta [Anaerolineae bacterium]|nr:phenylalanine--tRNA ligase subunit beta [Anaerolineae bacterium]
MLVPISWIKDFVDIPADMPAEVLAERLTLAGLEVGKIKYIGVPQGQIPGMTIPPSDHLVWDREKLVLGKIVEVKSHPDADRLVIAMVEYGGAELEACVTGAPNLYPYKDAGPLDPPLWSPFAKEGAEVWDGHSDTPQRMILKGRKLRGVYNKSMVCSEKELGLSDEHEGIMLLEPDLVAGFAPGAPLQDVLGDVILDIELTPNLARSWSVVGVAREVAALLGVEMRYPATDVLMEGAALEGRVQLEIREPELNPRFVLTLIEDVTIKPSPQWMRLRLRKAGMRPINNIVDITNYVMLETGQPLHAFDWDIVQRRAAQSGASTPTIITRLPEPGEEITLLDDSVHKLQEHNLLVADTAGALSLAGVMGGLESEVQPDSRSILLEAANWNFINVRRTMQSLKIASEAGTRFSRGVHPSQAELGILRATELMRVLGDGKVAQGAVDNYPLKPATVTVELPVAEVRRITGMDFSAEEVADLLRRLQFVVDRVADVLHVTAPDHRMDIGEGVIGQADLIEEITRIHGYDRIPDTVMDDLLPPQRSNPSLQNEEWTRDLLAGLGLNEVITYRFTTPAQEALLTPPGADSSLPQAEYVTMANPISVDKTVLRHTLLGGLLQVAAENARHAQRVRLFEIGAVYLWQQGQGLPAEPRRLGLLMTGPRDVPNWDLPPREGLVDFYDLKGVVEALLDGLHVPAASFAPGAHSSFFPGRVAELVIDGQPCGVLGEVHPRVLGAFDLPDDLPVMMAELDLDAILAGAQAMHMISPVPTQPAVYQDLALVVNAETLAAEVEAVLREAGGDLLEDVRLFDVYTGEPIPAGQKSLAYALTFRAPDQTLNEKAVNKLRQKIVKAAEHKLGAKLRE